MASIRLNEIRAELAEDEVYVKEATALMQADRARARNRLQRLCYSLFELNPEGKELLETMKEEFMTYRQANRASPNYQHDAIFEDGYLACLRDFSHNTIFYKHKCEVQP